MKRYILLAFVVVLAWNAKAQQDVLYSQYMFNLFTLNPAYAGSREAMSTVLLYRNQWAKIDGAPVSQSFSIHTPFEGKRVALGFNVVNEQIGPNNNLGAFGTYAYHLPLSKGRLSMALRGGGYRFQLNGEKLVYKDESDPLAGQSRTSKFVPSFDFGMYYYTHKLYAGVAVTHITQQKIGYYNYDGIQAQLKRHITAMAGYAIVLNQNVVLKPSALIKYTDAAPLNADVNMSVLLNKVFWIGASYRSSRDVVFITEFNITDFFRAGYSYDIGLNDLRTHNAGSHEIFVGFDFDISKETEELSPRYF